MVVSSLPETPAFRERRIFRHAHVTDIELAKKCKVWADQAIHLHMLGIPSSVANLCSFLKGAAVSSDNCKRSLMRASSACKAVDATTVSSRATAAEAELSRFKRATLDSVTKFQQKLDSWDPPITYEERKVRRLLHQKADMVGGASE